MKLTNIKITGFRSIKGSESMIVDPKMTILIGANDHGKSNILAAIKCLNDDASITPEDKNWDLKEDALVRIEWEFELNKSEIQKLRTFEIKQRDKKKQVVAVAEGATDTPSGEVIAEEPQEPTFEINQNGKITYYRDNQTNSVKVKSVPLTISTSKEAEILALRPRVELFESPSGNVVDQITLAQLEDPQYEFMQGIFRLAGIWDNRSTIFSQNASTSKQLDEASKRLTAILNDKWNQGKDLSWQLKHTGTNGDTILIEIQDPSIDTRYSRPSLRSSGFRTYFLLSMITLARTGNKPNNSYLFLFDEPGTYLHPHAQLDLQRSFETIADNTQIIYTTHSIFLINKNYPDRNRVISKHIEGTKIDQKPFVKNWKSVRESLGILLSNNFLIAEKTLLTEGPSDVIYILDVIKKLKSSGEVDIDMNDLSMVDCGDSDNYVSLCKLMLSEGRSIVALIDGDQSGKEVKKQLEKTCVNELSSNQLRIHLLPDNKSIEDIACDMDTLKSAIQEVNKNLVEQNIRTQVANFDLNTEISKIQTKADKTLGQTIDETTKDWFDPKGKISKLSIALKYEDLNSTTLNTLAKDEIEKIKTALSLRGEKSAEKGVFEEVK